MNSADVVSRIEAHNRADEIRAFRAELERLADDGALVLDGEQRRAVDEYHGRILAGLNSSLAPEESARSGPQVRLPPTEITVAFGRRLEPWVAGAVKRRVERLE